MAVEKNSAPKRQSRKQPVSVQDIRDVIAGIDLARAELVDVLQELDARRITQIAFDGIGNAQRGIFSLQSYGSAIRGAVTDPRSTKVYAEESPKPKKKSV